MVELGGKNRKRKKYGEKGDHPTIEIRTTDDL
jgi:hypothetical protein